MKTDCCDITYVDGFVHAELDKTEQDRFKSHLETCGKCRREVERLSHLAKALNAAYSTHLDETFNYSVINSLRANLRPSGVKEVRIAAEDMVITLATLLIIAIISIQVFDRPTVSPAEMAGSLTNIEKISVDQQTLSDDQVMELVMRNQ
jgi:hypothetical protein